MEEKTANLSHGSAANNAKESLLNTENKSTESQEVQAGDDAGALGSGWGATSEEIVKENKRGRGRPRKYEHGVPIINESLEAFPLPTAYCSTKRARGRPKGTGKFQALASVGGYMDTAGGSFTPHVLPVYKGEDLVNKITSFSARASRSVCVLTASGAVSSVTLCTPGSSIGTLTYEGRFEILTLTGSSVVSGELGTRRKTGLLSVSLANSHGRVFGGSVEGPLIAAGPGPIQLIVASFKQNIGPEIRRKYSGGTSTLANIFASSEMVNASIQVTGMADHDEKCTSPPVPIPVRAAPVKADSLKSDYVVAENHSLNSSSPKSAGPNNLQTLPVSQPISDELIIPDTNASVSKIHVKD